MLNAAAFDAMRRSARASYVRRPHDKALLSAVRRLGCATTRDVLREYYATPLQRHVSPRMVAVYLKRLREEGKLRGEYVSRGRYGATTIYTAQAMSCCNCGDAVRYATTDDGRTLVHVERDSVWCRSDKAALA